MSLRSLLTVGLALVTVSGRADSQDTPDTLPSSSAGTRCQPAEAAGIHRSADSTNLPTATTATTTTSVRSESV